MFKSVEIKAHQQPPIATTGNTYLIIIEFCFVEQLLKAELCISQTDYNIPTYSGRGGGGGGDETELKRL